MAFSDETEPTMLPTIRINKVRNLNKRLLDLSYQSYWYRKHMNGQNKNHPLRQPFVKSGRFILVKLFHPTCGNLNFFCTWSFFTLPFKYPSPLYSLFS